nr:serine/threonine-protein phosphatase 7 long form homolog [Ipomoea batatas]
MKERDDAGAQPSRRKEPSLAASTFGQHLRMPAVDPSPSPETTATACRQHLRAVQRWRRGGPSPVIQSHTAAATIKTGTVTGNSVRRFSGSDNQCKTDRKNSISVIFSTISIMAARRQLHPGPMDSSVLTFQHRHRSMSIWMDPDFNARIKPCRYDGQTVVPSDERMINYLRIAGFYGVSHLRDIRLDHSLIATLIERWRPEVHAFHLPFGEVGITLQDVEVLLGLKVGGLAVTGRVKRSTEQWKELCSRLLGFTPLDGFLKLSKINSTAIGPVPVLTADSTDDEVQIATRIQLMHLLGGLLFPESTNMAGVVQRS